MTEQINDHRKITLRKETIWNFSTFRLPLDDRGIPVERCFTNLWTVYYCDHFTTVTFKNDIDQEEDNRHILPKTPGL